MLHAFTPSLSRSLRYSPQDDQRIADQSEAMTRAILRDLFFQDLRAERDRQHREALAAAMDARRVVLFTSLTAADIDALLAD